MWPLEALHTVAYSVKVSHAALGLPLSLAEPLLLTGPQEFCAQGHQECKWEGKERQPHILHVSPLFKEGHDASSHQIALTKCECKGKLMKNYEGDGKALNLVWKPSEHAAL